MGLIQIAAVDAPQAQTNRRYFSLAEETGRHGIESAPRSRPLNRLIPDKLKPPVRKKLLYEEEGMIAQIIGGRIPGSIFATIRYRSSSIGVKAT